MIVAGCSQPAAKRFELSEVRESPMQNPQPIEAAELDLAAPSDFETATFALG